VLGSGGLRTEPYPNQKVAASEAVVTLSFSPANPT
jgi:hypothetical protein